MAVLKFSQIAPASSPPALTDTVIGVGSGTIDLQYSWNQIKTLIGGRTLLTANTTYNVSNIGDDITGDGSALKPWATLQHAFDFLGGNIDAAGFYIAIQLADGTYAGASLFSPIPNCPAFSIIGNLADQTKVVVQDTNPNGHFCISVECCFNLLQIASLTIETINGGDGVAISELTNDAWVDILMAAITFKASPTGGLAMGNQNLCLMAVGQVNGYPFSGGFLQAGMTIEGQWAYIHFAQAINCNFFILGNGNVVTFTGTPNIAVFHLGSTNFNYASFNAPFVGSVNPGAVLFQLDSGALLNDASTGWTGSGGTANNAWYKGTYYPNNTTGLGAAVQQSGLPSASNLIAGTWGVFKDTSGGGVYVAYNDGGTIKKVALT